MTSSITNPDAQFKALFASRPAPVATAPDRPLRWSVEAQVDALAPPNAERFEVFTTLSDGTVVSAGFGFCVGGKVAKRVAA